MTVNFKACDRRSCHSRRLCKFPNDHECLPGSDISYNRLEEIRKATEKDRE